MEKKENERYMKEKLLLLLIMMKILTVNLKQVCFGAQKKVLHLVIIISLRVLPDFQRPLLN